MKRRLINPAAAFFASALVLSAAGVAGADDISNGLDASVDAAAETLNVTEGGSAPTVSFRVTPRNGDGKNGCNLTGSTTLVVSVSSSNTAKATVSPSTLTFDSCDDTPSISVTPVAAGESIISLSQTSNDTGATFDLAPATFTVVVAAASDSCAGRTSPVAPTISEPNAATKSTSGWYSAASDAAVFEVSPSTNAEYSLDSGTSWTAYSGAVILGEGQHSVIARNFLGATTTPTCARVDGVSSAPTAIDVDTTPPSATPEDVVNTTWRNSSLSRTFTFGDSGSGLASLAGLSALGEYTVTASAESADSSTPTVESVTVFDIAGNSVTRSVSAFIDLTKPTVELTGGPVDGASYYFGAVPAAPGCTAWDGLSGLADADQSAAGDQDCTVSGYSAAVGTHTVTARAADEAGNTEQGSHTYTVLAWTLNGFYQPVDMTGVYNTVKGGSTVPLKFEAFAGATELTSTSVVKSFVQTKIACDGGSPTDEIEVTTTGGTTLRYDATAGQFVQNWQTPKQPGQCYRVTMTTQDDSALVAYFRLR